MISRRRFNQSLVALAFSGLSRHLLAAGTPSAAQANPMVTGYGPLRADPAGILDLPEGFSYQVISALGEMMDDGMTVPDRADGMGCIALDDERVALVRNHEISPSNSKEKGLPVSKLAYDHDRDNIALPGGTSTIVYNLKHKRVEKQFRSLIGTIRNCSGGITPWDSWLTCEESVDKASYYLRQDHGYVFEVPADATELVDAKPIKAMGRFNHEAACVDPRTGIVYLTEDRHDSLLYRYLPKEPGNLIAGGKLQALAIKGKPGFDSRNWDGNVSMTVGADFSVSWIDLDNVESPDDDLRFRGHQQGAALFARGEGIHWANDELYFCCTNGGAKQLGQVMRYVPSVHEGKAEEASQPGELSLFVESPNEQSFNYGDNITFAPHGHLIVCEDQYTDVVNNKLRGITPQGEIYDLAHINWQTEPAGACFSPDGKTLFVNLYSPTRTLAIQGPWDTFSHQPV